MSAWWKPYDGKTVGYIIERGSGWTPYLARCYPDGDRDLSQKDARLADDCILSVITSGPKQKTRERAVTFLRDQANSQDVFEIFEDPIPPGMIGISFLIELFMRKHGYDPR